MPCSPLSYLVIPNFDDFLGVGPGDAAKAGARRTTCGNALRLQAQRDTARKQAGLSLAR